MNQFIYLLSRIPGKGREEVLRERMPGFGKEGRGRGGERTGRLTSCAEAMYPLGEQI